jgi:anti-sigma B factor antagonist
MAHIEASRRAFDGVTTLHVTGPLTHGDQAGALYRAVVLLLKKGQSKLVIDLEGVTRLDATGVGELVDVEAAARHRGGGVILEGLDRQTEALLAKTKFLGHFEVPRAR